MKNETEKKTTEKPTLEMVEQWVAADLKTAHYFLGLLLRYPDVVRDAAKSIYEHAMRVENGSAVDHVKDNVKKTE